MLRAKRSINATTWEITLPQMPSLKLFARLIRTFSSCNHICKVESLPMVAENSSNPPDPIHEGCGSRHRFSTAENKEHEDEYSCPEAESLDACTSNGGGGTQPKRLRRRATKSSRR